MSTSAVTLTPKRLFEGVWTAIIQTTAKDAPDLIVTHLEKPLLGVSLTQIEDSNQWELQVPVPVEAICDGVQTFLMTDSAFRRVSSTAGPERLATGATFPLRKAREGKEE